MDPELIYTTPFFIASISIFIVALFIFPQRKTRGAGYLTWLCLAGAFWAASEGMLYLGLDIETNMLITYLQYLGIVALIPLTLLFTLSVFGFEAWISHTMVLLLLAAALAILSLVWTNPLHHMVFSDYFLIDTGPIPMLGLKHGPIWWGIIGYHYLLTALMSVILLRTVLTSSGVQRSQAGVVLAAMSVVWAVNAVYVAGHSPVPNMDIGPLAFILVAISMAWGFFRYNLLDVLPIAKAEIFMALSDPLLVIDEKNRVLDLNPAAETLFHLQASESIGQEIGHLLREHPHLGGLPKESRLEEICLMLEGSERNFDLRISALKDRRGTKIGRIIIFHDITERKRADDAMNESERLQGVLEMAGAVCHDMSQPVMALLGYSELIQRDVAMDDPLYPKTLKLTEQTKRLKDTTHKLMRITRYETRKYLGNKIIDIEKSSTRTDSQ